jgi:hypothetical protein
LRRRVLSLGLSAILTQDFPPVLSAPVVKEGAFLLLTVLFGIDLSLEDSIGGRGLPF